MYRLRLIIVAAIFLLAAGGLHAQELKSPEEFFGFQMGADGRLARWDKIVEYFQLLDSSSDRIVVRELGKSTEGNPFLLAIISSEENLRQMDGFREINRKLADPRGLSDAEIKQLLAEAKYTLAVTNSLHATEVGGTQMSSELAYELITDESEKGRLIRQNCFLLLFPCFNPDGQIMVVDYYDKYKGTEYEGGRLPYLYHKYTGHDNNRDGYALTQAEARLMSKVLYQVWWPHAYIDHHHMGSYGARFYIPPYFDPVHPNVDALIWREHMYYGAQMAMRLEEAGKTGIETGAPYTAWWMPSFHMITNYHNITGMLTESANAEIATPTYVHPHQLQPSWRGRPEYKAQVNFPSPWPGGWWRLRDVVEQIKISTFAALELGARNREMLISTALLKAQRNIELGRSEPPYAYVIPPDQHDPLTALKMLDTLMFAGVEVHRAEKAFTLGNENFPAGTYVIDLAQPLRTYVKSLMEQVFYPQNDWTSYRDGSPKRPYDMAAFTMAEHMGVGVVESHIPVEADLKKIDRPAYHQGGVIGESRNGYLLCHRLNDSFIALNRAAKDGIQVWWLPGEIEAGGFSFAPGAMLFKAEKSYLQPLAANLHLTFVAAPDNLPGEAYLVGKPRLGMYKRYQGGNMDEGWTRWLLEKFEFPYMSVFSDEIKKGNLRDKFDVILLPSDRLNSMIGPDYDKPDPGRLPVPPEYRTGLGEDGVKALREFVEAGGTLIALDSAAELPISKFSLPIENVLQDLPSTEFFCPGSTLWMQFDINNPIAYGMPEEALTINWASPAFAVRPVFNNENYKVVARYPHHDPLQSGWLIGPQYLFGKASLVEAGLGEGRIILIGFRPQLRAQTHGTFKILFNSIYYGAAELKPME